MTLTPSFIEKLKKEKDSLIIPRSDIVTKDVSTKILKEIQKTYNLDSQDEALAALAVFAQQGATAKNCDGNMEITLFGTTFKLSVIRKIFNTNDSKNGLRKFARTYAEKFLEITQYLELSGNLATKIKLANPDKTFTKKELGYLSDFHANNDKVPQDIRKLIMDTFKEKPRQKK